LKSCGGNSMDCQFIFSLKKHPYGRVQLSLCSREFGYLYCTLESTHILYSIGPEAVQR
jgi:hypothetical protein